MVCVSVAVVAAAAVFCSSTVITLSPLCRRQPSQGVHGGHSCLCVSTVITLSPLQRLSSSPLCRRKPPLHADGGHSCMCGRLPCFVSVAEEAVAVVCVSVAVVVAAVFCSSTLVIGHFVATSWLPAVVHVGG